MFQPSFTGSSRRQRQVNLSGRTPANPFTVGGSTAGAQAAIASAQQDRVERQQRRQEQQACGRIQRTWRGYHSRRQAHKAWRDTWDAVERDQHGAYPSLDASLSQMNRLMLFFSPKSDANDVDRLTSYGERHIATADSTTTPPSQDPWPRAYGRLRQACLEALQSERHGDDGTVLDILAYSTSRSSSFDGTAAIRYYRTLISLHGVSERALTAAILAPLHRFPNAYDGLAVLLQTPVDLPMLKLLQSTINPRIFAEAVARMPHDPALATRERVWLLRNLIRLCGSTDHATTTAIAPLLGSLADEIDFEGSPVSLDDTTFDREVLQNVTARVPLSTTLQRELHGLVSQDRVRNLLSQDVTPADAQLYASYALTLLRCFPRQADDIRMWLYLGSTGQATTTVYFWEAMKSNKLVSDIVRDSRSVLSLLQTSQDLKESWTVILMFLELYTFLLKIMDDEEFMGRTSGRQRQSAIPIGDVAYLVTFLKNLGFTLTFNASELDGRESLLARDVGSLRGHFGSPAAPEPLRRGRDAKSVSLHGIPGISWGYIKGIVTGLMRAIYERDSRRHFLPREHWLMTSRLDMTAFIPGVVAEEESRSVIAEQEEEDDDMAEDESDDEVTPSTTNLRGLDSYHRTQEARERAQRKASRRRYLENVAPRLEGQQMHRLTRHHAQIKRSSEFEDAFDAFYELGADLKEPIQITFMDEFGLQEAGIDGGGVTKEFLTSVVAQAFVDPNRTGADRYFIENENHLLYPNPTALEDYRSHSRMQGLGTRRSPLFDFLGRIIGKCLYEGILVDVSFAGFFLKKWALTGGHGSAPGESGYRASINDLRDFDQSLYAGLLALRTAPDASDFGLTFTVDDLIGRPGAQRPKSSPLIPGGTDIAVTNENRLLYLNKMSWYRLQGQSAAQTNAFLKGLATIVQPSWLSMFNQAELQTLIGGASAGINVPDLRANTLYGGTYVIGDDGREHPTVRLFWKVMASLTDAEKSKVLKFVTSTPRGPLLGFSSLNPRFSIRDSGSDESRYPSASTCVNLLKLPMYRSEKILREKLLGAVNSGAGFDLS
nr:hypothetical protein B0A51_06382 [Rachicladosporium sp. CCFEE 5018]